MGRSFVRTCATVLTVGLALATAPAQAAGFAIFEQGAKAMGMGGAFTAQADDPSAMFHNVGGLAMFEEREFYAGLSLISLGDSDFRGNPPFPGSDSTASQKDQLLVSPHFYWVEPMGERWTFGAHLNAPFGLETAWDDPDSFDGRFISTRAELQSVDVGANAGYRLNENVGLGFGVFVRNAKVELEQRAGAVNPFTLAVTDIANVALESDLEQGFGFQLGLLHEVTEKFSWGFNYRSKVDVDFSGDARFTQIFTGNPTFDGIVAGQLPSGETPIETNIEFPDQAFLGFAYSITGSTLIEADVIWHGWSTFDVLTIDFTRDSEFTAVRPQRWEDVYAYRFGLSWDTSERSQWRFGYYYDESPQPTEGVGPLLPDADRNGFSVGYGHTGQRLQSDFFFLWVKFNDRETNDGTTQVNLDGFDGRYETNVLLLGATFGW